MEKMLIVAILCLNILVIGCSQNLDNVQEPDLNTSTQERGPDKENEQEIKQDRSLHPKTERQKNHLSTNWTSDRPILGESSAPITLYKFTDFEEILSKRFYEMTQPKIVEEYVKTGRVKIVYKNFPLFSKRYETHKAADCVYKKGGSEAYYEYTRILYTNRDAIDEDSDTHSKKNLELWAKNIGHNISDCIAKVDDAEILQDKSEGEEIDQRSGVPMFYLVNSKGESRTILGAKRIDVFREKIESLKVKN